MKNYQNPIIPNSAANNTSDPYVIRHNGKYYHCYSTENAVCISESDSLFGIGGGKVHTVYDCEKEGALKEWYAPELHKIGDAWYIYAAPDHGANMHVMTALAHKGDGPVGEYEYMGKVSGIEQRWQIDGTVLYHGGELYYVWTTCRKLYMAKMSDPLSVTGRVCELSEPSLAFETKVGLVMEGPAVLYRNGKIHIVYSANDSKYDEYCLGILTFDGSGDILDRENWKKTDRAVFEKTDKIFGPGHCSFTTVTEGENEVDYIVYHANLTSGTGWTGRSVFTQPFTWDENDFPVFGKPEF